MGVERILRLLAQHDIRGHILRDRPHRRYLPRQRAGDRRRRATKSATTAICTRIRCRSPRKMPSGACWNGACVALDQAVGRTPGRLPLAGLGQQPPHDRTAARIRLPLRELADGPGLHAVLVPRRRRDPAGRPIPLRPEGRSGRDAGQLDPRRLSALRVRQRVANGSAPASPRLEGRGDLARRVRLHAIATCRAASTP